MYLATCLSDGMKDNENEAHCRALGSHRQAYREEKI
jgi:hypothetical protein